MKYAVGGGADGANLSLPIRGAWIEIQQLHRYGAVIVGSLPIRGAWIEISMTPRVSRPRFVAPHPGSVD